jgi:hypothetical protein
VPDADFDLAKFCKEAVPKCAAANLQIGPRAMQSQKTRAPVYPQRPRRETMSGSRFAYDLERN